MIIALWILNALLAVAFVGAGAMKSIRSKEQLQTAGMAWTEDFQAPAIKAIGIAEVLGGIGLILPLATDIAPILTPLAATALTVTMVAAVVVHVRRSEAATPSLVLGVLSAASAVLGFLVLA